MAISSKGIPEDIKKVLSYSDSPPAIAAETVSELKSKLMEAARTLQKRCEELKPKWLRKFNEERGKKGGEGRRRRGG